MDERRPLLPSADQGIGASFMLVDFYGRGSQFDAPDEVDLKRQLSDSDVEQRLLSLERDIEAGEITTHRQVSRVVFGLGTSLTPVTPTSQRVGDAAFFAAIAIREHQASFTDHAEVIARAAERSQG